MSRINCFAAFATITLLFAAPALHAQATMGSINKQMEALRTLTDDQKPAAIKQLAADVATLPPGPAKVKLATSLVRPVTEGDLGSDARQSVADTLTKALAESPVAMNDPAFGPGAFDDSASVGRSPAAPAPKVDTTGQPPRPYMALARLVRYDGAKTALADPMYLQARALLIQNDIDVSKADFTLTDLDHKKVTLSQLRGKIVVVTFWNTGNKLCLQQMPALDFLSTYFKDQGLVVLALTDEFEANVFGYLSQSNYHPTVLLDPEGKVAKQFHVDTKPRTYIFNRDGKLIGEAVNLRTQKQFLLLMARTDLHPNDKK